MSDQATPEHRSTFDVRTLLKWVLFCLVALLLAWRIVTANLADHSLASGDPLRALALRGDHFAALDAAAIDSLRSNPGHAVALLQQSIVANPARGMSYARLGALWDLEGLASDKVPTAIEVGVRLAPAQVDTRLMAAAVEFGRDNLAAALEHWDVVMTRRGAVRQELYPLLLSLAKHPENLGAFRSLVGTRPVQWWPWFVAYAANNAEELEVAMRLFNLNRGSGLNPVVGQPLGAVLRRLQREGLWLDAHLVWLNSLSEMQIEGMGNLFNGSFEQTISDIGFDWIRARAGHIVVEPTPTQAVDGEHALRVHFRGPRVQFRHLSQLVMLPPGDYVLHGYARPEGFEAVHGLMWTVSCVGERERRVGQSPHFKGRGPWQSFEATFTVPSQGCPAQIVRLQLDGRVPLDYEARGVIWFDAMSIHRQTATPPAS